jgi:hypothetical protein
MICTKEMYNMENSKSKKFKVFLRGDIGDALVLSKEDYEKKTKERFLRGEYVMVEIETDEG